MYTVDAMLWLLFLCCAAMKDKYQTLLASLPKGLRTRMALAIKEQLSIPNGHQEKWEKLMENLPTKSSAHLSFNTQAITVGTLEDIGLEEQNRLRASLQTLHPWRKGPFSFYGIELTTEWRSDWKWNRLSKHITPVQGRKILDVGCGSGYHCWRMYGEGASFVLGIDPSLLFWMQFRACKKMLQASSSKPLPVYYAPIPMDKFPINTQYFDTVFSMGVLYHRRDPFSHLERLKHALKKGGELVLETLIMDGPLHHCFVPKDRYAQMRNVWCIPSLPTLSQWLERCGFCDIRVVDVNQTSTQEQRATPWMRFQSLVDFLDPEDINKTTEGYPAPKRAILLAKRP